MTQMDPTMEMMSNKILSMISNEDDDGMRIIGLKILMSQSDFYINEFFEKHGHYWNNLFNLKEFNGQKFELVRRIGRKQTNRDKPWAELGDSRENSDGFLCSREGRFVVMMRWNIMLFKKTEDGSTT
jgi:hypothetical protein